MFVASEAGIGMTALVQAFCTELDHLHRLAWVRSARAEYAALQGDSETVRIETRDAYRIPLERRQPGLVCELGYWLWTTGELRSLPHIATGPFALQAAGRSLEEAHAWQESGCPYEAVRARASSGDEREIRNALEACTTLGARPAGVLAARSL